MLGSDVILRQKINKYNQIFCESTNTLQLGHVKNKGRLSGVSSYRRKASNMEYTCII